jgi:aminopeptidase C
MWQGSDDYSALSLFPGRLVRGDEIKEVDPHCARIYKSWAQTDEELGLYEQANMLRQNLLGERIFSKEEIRMMRAARDAANPIKLDSWDPMGR